MVFVRRVITREADPHEEHTPVTPLQFRLMKGDGAFALSWSANGLSYGLPADINDDIARGAVVVANVSRDVVPMVRETFARTLVLHVTASADVLSQRLAARGREDEAGQSERLARSLLREQTVEADIRIENNGDLASAQAQFISVLNLFIAPLQERQATA